MARLITNPDGIKVLWFGGEMAIPMGLRCHEARAVMAKIAEECGYIVSNGRSRFTVSGGDIIGYYTLDWFDGERPGPVKVEHWTCTSKYLTSA